MLFNTLNLIFLNVTMPNFTKKIFTQISLAGLYLHRFVSHLALVMNLVSALLQPTLRDSHCERLRDLQESS